MMAAGVSWLLLGGRKDIVKTQLNAEELVYLCEGQHSIICSYTGKSRDWRGRLLLLPKDDASRGTVSESLLLRTKVQKCLAGFCFETRYIDQPQAVVLPSANVRAIDAHLMSARPQQQRQVRLNLQEYAEHPGHCLALRLTNLMEAPPSQSQGAGASPMVTVELPLGCGMKEVDGLPSRHALSLLLAEPTPAKADAAVYDPVVFFSGSRAQVADALQGTVAVPSRGYCLRIFVDGRPVFPAMLPGAEGATALRKAASGSDALASKLEGCAPSSSEELIAALTALIMDSQRGHGFLVDLQRLQCYAAGECEKMASLLLQELQEHGGATAVDALRQGGLIPDFIARASTGWTGKDGVRAHEREGRRLMALSTWGPQEVAALQQWLGLFLLGRAALSASVLVSFFSPSKGAEVEAGEQRRLRALRFEPLRDFLPDKAWCADVWIRMTVVGLEPRSPEEIAQCGGELEDLVRRYRESLAAAK